MPFTSLMILIPEIKEYLPAQSFSVPNIDSQWLKLEIDGPGEFPKDEDNNTIFITGITINYLSTEKTFYGGDVHNDGSPGIYDYDLDDYKNDPDSDVYEKFNDKIRSIQIQGNYLVLLFEDKDYGGKCEVFTSSDSDLKKDNYIGKDTTSFKVRAIK